MVGEKLSKFQSDVKSTLSGSIESNIRVSLENKVQISKENILNTVKSKIDAAKIKLQQKIVLYIYFIIFILG